MTYFKKENDVVLVYLFGSCAKGNAHLLSDIDLGILFDDIFKLKNSL